MVGRDADDFIGLLSSSDEILPVVFEETETPGTPAVLSAGTDVEWQNDPVPVKLDKIRAAFLNARTASEVAAQSSTMLIGDWLEMVVKLSPKNVQITGGLSLRHMLEELGPINKDNYRPKAIECQYEEVAS